jgi:hypothetical protein
VRRQGKTGERRKETWIMNGWKELAQLTVATEIDSFLSGENNGAALFQALYGAVANEPVPERLLAVLRLGCAPALAVTTVPALDAAAS